jgi:hypothetical protein
LAWQGGRAKTESRNFSVLVPGRTVPRFPSRVASPFPDPAPAPPRPSSPSSRRSHLARSALCRHRQDRVPLGFPGRVRPPIGCTSATDYRGPHRVITAVMTGIDRTRLDGGVGAGKPLRGAPLRSAQERGEGEKASQGQGKGRSSWKVPPHSPRRTRGADKKKERGGVCVWHPVIAQSLLLAAWRRAGAPARPRQYPPSCVCLSHPCPHLP